MDVFEELRPDTASKELKLRGPEAKWARSVLLGCSSPGASLAAIRIFEGFGSFFRSRDEMGDSCIRFVRLGHESFLDKTARWANVLL